METFNYFKDEQLQNISFIDYTFSVLKLEISNFSKKEHQPNKEGIPANRVKAFIKSLGKCANIRIIGLMCVATMTYDTDLIEKQFSKMKKLKEEIEEMNLEYAPCHELSMGMSNDYKLALKYGATTIRIGRFFLE